MSAPSIKSIAEAAGVSIATVSLALRNHPRISAATVERVQRAAEKLGYRPNPLVTALMAHVRNTSRSEAGATLAFLNAFPEKNPQKISPAFSRYYRGVADRASELGFAVDTFWTKESAMTARRLSNILLARGITGVVVGPLPRGRGHLSLNWEYFSACAMGYSMWRPHLHRSVAHHAHAMSVAVRKLARLGYRRIGFAISPNFDERVDHHWLAHFFWHQHTLEKKDVVPILVDDTANMQKFPKWFAQHRPDAVIAAHSCAFEWLEKLKVDVPGEVGFVHLDVDRELMKFSGIDQRPELIGSATVDLIAGQLNHNERGIPENPRLLMIEPAWVDGSTTRPEASAHGPVARAPRKKPTKVRVR